MDDDIHIKDLPHLNNCLYEYFGLFPLRFFLSEYGGSHSYLFLLTCC